MIALQSRQFLTRLSDAYP